MEKMNFLCDFIESKDDNEKQKGNEIKNKLKELAEKYKAIRPDEVEVDAELKENIPIKSRGSEVYGFYVFEEWIYLLDDEMNDIDPNDVEIDFLEKFISYISDENNVSIEEDETT